MGKCGFCPLRIKFYWSSVFLFAFYQVSFCEMTGSLFGLHFSLHKSFPRVTEVLPFIDGDFCGKCRNAIMDVPGGRLHQLIESLGDTNGPHMHQEFA